MSLDKMLERERRVQQIIQWVSEDDTIGQDVLAIIMAGLRRDKDSWREQAMEMETLVIQGEMKFRGKKAASEKERFLGIKIGKLKRFRNRLFFNWDHLIGKKEEENG